MFDITVEPRSDEVEWINNVYWKRSSIRDNEISL